MTKINWKGFFTKLVALAPTIVAGTAALTNETGSVDKQQEATDALNLAAGIGEVISAEDPAAEAIIAAASSITAQVIKATSAAHAAQGLPNLEDTKPVTENVQAPATPTPPAAVTGTATIVG